MYYVPKQKFRTLPFKRLAPVISTTRLQQIIIQFVSSVKSSSRLSHYTNKMVLISTLPKLSLGLHILSKLITESSYWYAFWHIASAGGSLTTLLCITGCRVILNKQQFTCQVLGLHFHQIWPGGAEVYRWHALAINEVVRTMCISGLEKRL